MSTKNRETLASRARYAYEVEISSREGVYSNMINDVLENVTCLIDELIIKEANSGLCQTRIATNEFLSTIESLVRHNENPSVMINSDFLRKKALDIINEWLISEALSVNISKSNSETIFIVGW